MCILSSPGLPSFAWILLIWILCVTRCLVLFYTFYWQIPLLDPWIPSIMDSSNQFPKEWHSLASCRAWWSKRKMLPLVFAIFLSKLISGRNFLERISLPSDVTWKPLCSACAIINRFVFRRVIIYVSVNIAQWIFTSRFWYPCKYPHFVLVSIPLSPIVTIFWHLLYSWLFVPWLLYVTCHHNIGFVFAVIFFPFDFCDDHFCVYDFFGHVGISLFVIFFL